MDKQEALVKLAQVKLAASYVLRQRMMKQAGWWDYLRNLLGGKPATVTPPKKEVKKQPEQPEAPQQVQPLPPDTFKPGGLFMYR